MLDTALAGGTVVAMTLTAIAGGLGPDAIYLGDPGSPQTTSSSWAAGSARRPLASTAGPKARTQATATSCPAAARARASGTSGWR